VNRDGGVVDATELPEGARCDQGLYQGRARQGQQHLQGPRYCSCESNQSCGMPPKGEACPKHFLCNISFKTESRCGILHKCSCKANCQNSQLDGKGDSQFIQSKDFMQIMNLGAGKNNCVTKNSWCAVPSRRVLWHFSFKRFGNVLWLLEER
jgi:hypothetical protein